MIVEELLKQYNGEELLRAICNYFENSSSFGGCSFENDDIQDIDFNDEEFNDIIDTLIEEIFKKYDDKFKDILDDILDDIYDTFYYHWYSGVYESDNDFSKIGDILVKRNGWIMDEYGDYFIDNETMENFHFLSKYDGLETGNVDIYNFLDYVKDCGINDIYNDDVDIFYNSSTIFEFPYEDGITSKEEADEYIKKIKKFID